jgi:tRNA dimethylallyltransferase
MTESDMPRVVALTGATAVGKTEVALALADRRSISIISMDSAMVYRGMDIGTAKPDRDTLSRYPHALIDIRDPADPYSAADFVDDADRQVSIALDAGKLPVIVGGTMLYARAFRDGLARLPSADPELRARLVEQAQVHGWEKLYDRLEKLDPQAAKSIHPNNTQRVQRALEVIETTGRPISELWREQGGEAAAARMGTELIEVAVVPDDRTALHRRIEQRFRTMLTEGLESEVVALRGNDGLHPGLPSMRAVGYRQMWQHLEGALSAREMQEKAIAATRQLAKRQLTWLRGWGWIPQLTWGDASEVAEQIVGLVNRGLLQ